MVILAYLVVFFFRLIYERTLLPIILIVAVMLCVALAK